MESPILDFFKLILKITLELAPDANHKGLKITKVLLEEELKLLPGYRNILALVTSVTILVLHPLEANTLAEERNSKQGAIDLNGPSGIKMIFVLLADVVGVHL